MISIVIPTRNRPDLLVRAVHSAIEGLPPNGEIIVVDDGSIPASDVVKGLREPSIKLIVVKNTGVNGAAGARNFGIGTASSPVILFLDDDDELLPDYASRVQQVSEAFPQAGFGFSAVSVAEKGLNPILYGPRRLKAGLVPVGSPLRYRIAPFSAGFWVRRELALRVGGVPEVQTVDEDTGFCLRLLRASAKAWYESEPGVRVYRGHSAAGTDADQLTRKTPNEIVLECYRRTWLDHEQDFSRWSEARWFLAARYLRRATKSGHFSDGLDFIRRVRPYSFRLALYVFWLAKSATARYRSSGG
jgi:glycosyltransferase involved in cell wall biosynthesis